MNYYIVRYPNNYSDIIITDADKDEFESAVKAVEELMSNYFFDPEGETKTDMIARELRLNNLDERVIENVTETVAD